MLIRLFLIVVLLCAQQAVAQTDSRSVWFAPEIGVGISTGPVNGYPINTNPSYSWRLGALLGIELGRNWAFATGLRYQFMRYGFDVKGLDFVGNPTNIEYHYRYGNGSVGIPLLVRKRIDLGTVGLEVGGGVSVQNYMIETRRVTAPANSQLQGSSFSYNMFGDLGLGFHLEPMLLLGNDLRWSIGPALFYNVYDVTNSSALNFFGAHLTASRRF